MGFIGELIKKLRTRKALSIRDFAQQIELSEFEVTQIEKNIKTLPKPYHLNLIAKVTGFSFAELLKRAGCIDTYSNAGKVQYVFDRIQMLPNEGMHIVSVDDLTEEEIEGMIEQNIIFRSLKEKEIND
jgi:transcriptional regulator with XRE-family HTH domain